MFDLSWTELLFVALLALLVVGPKDMPKLFKVGGRIIAKLQRSYRDFLGSMHQLEKEVDIASGDHQQDDSWRSMMPESIRNLPEDFIPGSMSASEHQERRRAREAFIAKQSPPSSSQTTD